MANVEHSALTGANLHEPKGAAAAASGKVYIADGAGSGTWDFVKPPGTATALAGQAYLADGAGGGAYANPASSQLDYGELYIQSNATATTITASSTFVKITAGVVTGPVSGMTFTTDHLNVVDSGKYALCANLTFFGIAATTIVWEFDFMIAAAAFGRKMAVTTTGTERVTVSLSAITGTLAPADQISLAVSNTTDTNDPTIVHASLVARQL